MANMKDKKAAKQIIKRAKHNPSLYSKDEVKYAKIYLKRLKREKKQHEREISERDSRRREAHGLRGEGEQPKESRQSKRRWFTKLLYQARSLVRF